MQCYNKIGFENRKFSSRAKGKNAKTSARRENFGIGRETAALRMLLQKMIRKTA